MTSEPTCLEQVIEEIYDDAGTSDADMKIMVSAAKKLIEARTASRAYLQPWKVTAIACAIKREITSINADSLHTRDSVATMARIHSANSLRRALELLESCEISESRVSLDAYDTGLLGDGGGGDVDWWHTYIRNELDRAHEYYQSQLQPIS